MSGPLETVLAPAHAGTWHLDTDQSTCRFTVRDKLVTAGIEPGGGTPAQFGSFIQSEMQRWARVAQAAGVQPE